ncbi:MAG: hypothetical protein AAF530_24960 [Pseudomonadota bacterium]
MRWANLGKFSSIIIFTIAAVFPTIVHSGGDSKEELDAFDEFAATALSRFAVELPGVFGTPADPFSNSISPARAKSFLARTATYKIPNFDATTEKGEPRFNGRMKRTLWMKMVPERNATAVIHTFGSDYDTALAVHTGKRVNKLKKVVFNDNFNIPGISRTHSLVEFSAKKNVRYSIQVGSKKKETGTVLVTGSILPPAGGLSVFLAQVDGQNYGGRNYICVIGNGEGNDCGDPTFLLYNSHSKNLRISANHSLGPDVAAPADIVLAPGEAATMKFSFGAGFDTSTLRTISGWFSFTANKGKKLINKIDLPGLITVQDDFGAPEALTAEISPPIQAGQINEPLIFEVKLSNDGSAKAIGCHARADRFIFTKVSWAEVKSKKKGGVGEANKVFSIAPGKTKKLLVAVAPMQAQVADPTFPGSNEVRIDCANTSHLLYDLTNNFDFSVRGSWVPAKMTARILSPKGDVIRVPKKKSASFTASIKNDGKSKASLRVTPTYGAPFAENDRYSMTICKLTKKNGKCETPASFSVNFDAKKKSTHYVKVFVSAPANDPGFDPEKRRVFVNVWQNKPKPNLPGTSSVIIASDSIAPRRK